MTIESMFGVFLMLVGLAIIFGLTIYKSVPRSTPNYQKKGLEPLHPVHHWENQKRKNGKFSK